MAICRGLGETLAGYCWSIDNLAGGSDGIVMPEAETDVADKQEPPARETSPLCDRLVVQTAPERNPEETIYLCELGKAK